MAIWPWCRLSSKDKNRAAATLSRQSQRNEGREGKQKQMMWMTIILSTDVRTLCWAKKREFIGSCIYYWSRIWEEELSFRGIIWKIWSDHKVWQMKSIENYDRKSKDFSSRMVFCFRGENIERHHHERLSVYGTSNWRLLENSMKRRVKKSRSIEFLIDISGKECIMMWIFCCCCILVYCRMQHYSYGDIYILWVILT